MNHILMTSRSSNNKIGANYQVRHRSRYDNKRSRSRSRSYDYKRSRSRSRHHRSNILDIYRHSDNRGRCNNSDIDRKYAKSHYSHECSCEKLHEKNYRRQRSRQRSRSRSLVKSKRSVRINDADIDKRSEMRIDKQTQTSDVQIETIFRELMDKSLESLMEKMSKDNIVEEVTEVLKRHQDGERKKILERHYMGRSANNDIHPLEDPQYNHTDNYGFIHDERIQRSQPNTSDRVESDGYQRVHNLSASSDLAQTYVPCAVVDVTRIKEQNLKEVPAIPKSTIKNNNPNWHCLNKNTGCPICRIRPRNSLINHFVNDHPNDEVFISRIDPAVADLLRNKMAINKFKQVKWNKNGLNQFCFFCNENKTFRKSGWIRHMAVHTSYYEHKCLKCSQIMIERHTRHACRTKNHFERIPQPQFQKEELMAYICDLCNFVRFHKNEIETHLSCEHEGNVTNRFKEILFLSLPNQKDKFEEEFENQLESGTDDTTAAGLEINVPIEGYHKAAFYTREF